MFARMPDNREIYYNSQGDGPPLLIVHGGFSDADTFAMLVAGLAPHCRCIMLDRLGYSRSAQLDHPTTVDEQVDAIAAIHSAVTARPAWVWAHSGGGNYALAYALAHPGRVKGLILYEPALYALYPVKPPEVVRMETDIMQLLERGETEQGVAAFFALFGWPPPQGPAGPPARVLRYDQPAVTSWRPSTQELEQMTLPVLLLDGDRSPALLRDICVLLAAQLPHATRVTLAGQDHLGPWTATQRVVDESLAFIRQSL